MSNTPSGSTQGRGIAQFSCLVDPKTGECPDRFRKSKSQMAMDEAKRKTEASKQSALGYFTNLGGSTGSIPGTTAGTLKTPVGAELINQNQQNQLLATRRAQLGAYGQNLANMYSNPNSGVQSGIRQQIGMGIAGKEANLPIELQLEMARQNRAAQENQQRLGLQGYQAQTQRAGAMANVQMGYNYDPGLEYIRQLGYGLGRIGA